jgi:hypothetical protein
MITNVQISTSDCTFKKDRKTLVVSSTFTGNRFPVKVTVKSHITGKLVEFVGLDETDPEFCQDSWDGEQCMYRATTVEKNIVYLIVAHGF